MLILLSVSPWRRCRKGCDWPEQSLV